MNEEESWPIKQTKQRHKGEKQDYAFEDLQTTEYKTRNAK